MRSSRRRVRESSRTLWRPANASRDRRHVMHGLSPHHALVDVHILWVRFRAQHAVWHTSCRESFAWASGQPTFEGHLFHFICVARCFGSCAQLCCLDGTRKNQGQARRFHHRFCDTCPIYIYIYFFHVHTCVYNIHLYLYVCMYVRTYVCMYVCMYVCNVGMCMYVHKYIYTIIMFVFVRMYVEISKWDSDYDVFARVCRRSRAKLGNYDGNGIRIRTSLGVRRRGPVASGVEGHPLIHPSNSASSMCFYEGKAMA